MVVEHRDSIGQKRSASQRECSCMFAPFQALWIAIGFRLLPFPLTSGIISVCLDLAGRFRNKDTFVLMIRLARMGARKQPFYRIVVIEKARARNGRPVEVVGTYNPRTTPTSIDFKRDRVDYWVSKGAQMSERVGKLYSKPAAAPAASVA